MNQQNENSFGIRDDNDEISIEELDQVAGGFGDTPGLNGGDMMVAPKVRRVNLDSAGTKE